jgi:hypothetical protein
MDLKITSVLIGVILGWLLSQLTDFAKSRIDRKRKIKAIYIELEDISAWLSRLMYSSKQSIMLALNKKITTNAPTQLHKFLLDEYFSEICIYLPRDARLGLVDCYSQIENINEIVKQIVGLLENPSQVKSQDVVKKYTSLYCCVFESKFKVDFLIKNRDGDIRKLKGAALKLSEELKIELDEIFKEAQAKDAVKINMDYYSEE